jgi:predicted amidohydrolase
MVESHKENEKEEDKLLNVCYFIDHEGSVTGKYVKKNLWYVHLTSVIFPVSGVIELYRDCGERAPESLHSSYRLNLSH